MAAQFKIIVAEDEELQLNSLIRKIRDVDADFTVAGAAQTGTQAYDLVCRTEPDVLITDIRMPVMSGIELLEKTRDRYPMMQFIIVSGFSDFECARSAIRLQVSDYLLKPIETEELKKALAKVKNRFLAERSNFRDIFTPELSRQTPEQIASTLKEYLRKNYARDINLNGIAANMNYSSSYLTRLFLQQYDTTPSKYIISLRMQKAQQLLAHSPELSVRQVGEAVGYPEQGYFSRIFKKQVGVSPLDYRGR